MSNTLIQQLLRKLYRARYTAWAALVLAAPPPAQATLVATEKQVLADLYNSTNGPGWVYRDGWSTTGTVGATDPCDDAWYGVTCDAAKEHVTALYLSQNNLTGALPASLNQLTVLQGISIDGNHLTGSIPSLSGLTSLQGFIAINNEFTGTIPNLSGLTALQQFLAWNNRLTGSIPSLGGLTSLERFDVSQNQLTGSIPDLNGLTSLRDFNVHYNQLTGSIPSLSGLTSLWKFAVSYNQLTGPIPSLSGLTELDAFSAGNNQLTGTIPSLSGLRTLRFFGVRMNQLTGTIPSLDGLTALEVLEVEMNRLSGAVPTAPASLRAGLSLLCPNYLTPSVDPAWDIATRGTPWSADCIGPPAPPSAPRLAQLSDTGTSGDGITANRQPELVGNAEANSIVELFDGATSLGTTTADEYWQWSFTSVTPLTTGPGHSITARASNPAGSSPASDALALNIALHDAPVGSAHVLLTSSMQGCALTAQPAFSTPDLNNAPKGASAPLQQLGFGASDCSGGTLTAQVAYPAGSLAGLTAYKYGPTSAGGAPAWFPLGTVSGDTVIWSVTDNRAGDSDPIVGAITDPHAMLLVAADDATPVPTLGHWGMALLGLLTAGLGVRWLRRSA